MENLNFINHITDWLRYGVPGLGALGIVVVFLILWKNGAKKNYEIMLGVFMAFIIAIIALISWQSAPKIEKVITEDSISLEKHIGKQEELAEQYNKLKAQYDSLLIAHKKIIASSSKPKSNGISIYSPKLYIPPTIDSVYLRTVKMPNTNIRSKSNQLNAQNPLIYKQLKNNDR